MCFEAVYIGVGYKPAKGAQEWRSSLGPMFGIMSNLIKACTWPETASVTGKLTCELPTGKKIVVEDTFFWIVITMRNPYNGALTDSMWVSYLTLDSFPGFNRMMDSFTPPMECISGLVNLFDAHYEVRSFEWAQTEPANIGVCLDGDPTDAGNTMTASLMPGAWSVVAPPTYPTRVAEEHTKQGELTEGAEKWLAANPVPEGVFYPSPKPKPQQAGIFC
jgi:hypothetical protein